MLILILLNCNDKMKGEKNAEFAKYIYNKKHNNIFYNNKYNLQPSYAFL